MLFFSFLVALHIYKDAFIRQMGRGVVQVCVRSKTNECTAGD